MHILRFRRSALALAISLRFVSSPATAAVPDQPNAASNSARKFVSKDIQKGFSILNDKGLTILQRDEQFKSYLFEIIDMQRIARFTLGPYWDKASENDQAAFVKAFTDYAGSIYESYFSKYAGQTLDVSSSKERAPGDFIVATSLSRDVGQKPLEIDFRVRTDTGHPVLVDFSVSRIWLASEERDQFQAYLSQHHGDLQGLIAHFRSVASLYHD